MFGNFGLLEISIVLLIVLLIFGGSKIRSIGSDIGEGVKGFKKAINNDEAEEDNIDNKN
tara:strand:+ start:39035 stop:39211 length:177 start_codon:yes stop_codon:yes gene_type:complete